MRRVLVICLVGLASCGPENTYQEPPPPQVTVAPPEVREVTTYDSFVGRAEAVETIEIRARVKGFLETIEFAPSDLVEAGSTLFTIEKAPFQAARDAADAQLKVAIANKDLQEATYLRTKDSFDKGAASEIELLEVTAKRDAADAEVGVARAALDAAEIDLGYTTITTPVTGRVSRDLVNLGNLVGADGSTLLTTVVVDDPIHVYFNVDERSLLRYLELRPREERGRDRQPVSFELLDGREYESTGHVDFGENRVDPNTGTIEIRAEVPNPAGQLFPGLFMRVKVPRTTEEAMLVPETSLQRDLTGPYLLVVNAENVVARRDVTLGDKTGRQRIIAEGLEVDERVIVNGLQRARPGLTVAPVSEGEDG